MNRSAVVGCVLLLLPMAAAGQQAAPAGRWSGSMEAADGTPIDLTVELKRAADGVWFGTLTAPSVQLEPLPLEALAVSADEVRFSAPGLPGAPEFVGRLSPEGGEMTGSYSAEPPPAPPSTDIYLMELEADGAAWRLGEPINITDRDGYDNQPRFLPDGSALLYTSIRDGQADVYRYEPASGRRARVTETAESEYSPTPLPSDDGFSTVRVEDDGTQRLWSFDLAGREPMLVLEALQPVGYHAWIDDHRLALFVLGSPPTLEIVDADLEARRIVASSIGRSIHLTPDGSAVSFVHKLSDGDWRIEAYELDSGERRALIATRGGGEDFAWLPDGRIVMADGAALFTCSPNDGSPGWRQVAELSDRGIAGITRLDVSRDGRRLALVGERPAAPPAAERVGGGFTLRKAG